MCRLSRWMGLLLASLFLCFTLSCEEAIELPEAEYDISFAEEYLTLGKNAVKLLYPTIIGYTSSEREMAVNAAARQLARDMYESEALMSGDGNGYEYTATGAYVTLATEDFYSVRIHGVIASRDSGGRDTFAYTMNCDLTTGAFLDSEAIIADYPALVTAFTADTFTANFGGEPLEGVLSKETLIAPYKAEYALYPYVYFLQGQLGILVDTLPSLGDGCAGYAADIRQVRAYLRTDTPAIAALCGLDTINTTETDE